MRTFVTGLVLAAGRSQRLGQPKQLLDVGGRHLLDVTLDMARACGFDQLVVALGGAGDDVRRAVDLSGCDVVDNVHHTTGCSSSIVAALDHVDARAAGLVLLLGDQPGVDPTIARQIAGVRHVPTGPVPTGAGEADRRRWVPDASRRRPDLARPRSSGAAVLGRDPEAAVLPPIAVCRYDDGRGHPFWFPRGTFVELAGLHGDKAVWKLLESGRWPVVELPVAGPVPLDVDTWDDYHRLLETTT